MEWCVVRPQPQSLHLDQLETQPKTPKPLSFGIFKPHNFIENEQALESYLIDEINLKVQLEDFDR